MERLQHGELWERTTSISNTTKTARGTEVVAAVIKRDGGYLIC